MTSASTHDRAMGSLVGLAIGDALGAPLEFTSRDAQPPLTDIVGGGPHELRAGQWTDDTSLALCVAESLIETGGYDPIDQLRRFLRWFEDGHLSSTGVCFDIGAQTARALRDFSLTGEAYRTDVPGQTTSGNGALMRLAPLAMAFHPDPARAGRIAADSARTTHPSVDCLEACRSYAMLVAAAINGADKSTLWDTAGAIATTCISAPVSRVLAGRFRTLFRSEVSSSGYVVDSMEAALWSFAHSRGFEEGALLAVNLGHDADTVGAIYGQLAGAYYGASGLPERWRSVLHDRQRIEGWARIIADRAGGFTAPDAV